MFGGFNAAASNLLGVWIGGWFRNSTPTIAPTKTLFPLDPSLQGSSVRVVEGTVTNGGERSTNTGFGWCHEYEEYGDCFGDGGWDEECTGLMLGVGGFGYAGLRLVNGGILLVFGVWCLGRLWTGIWVGRKS